MTTPSYLSTPTEKGGGEYQVNDHAYVRSGTMGCAHRNEQGYRCGYMLNQHAPEVR